jgi:hypothetical protein
MQDMEFSFFCKSGEQLISAREYAHFRIIGTLRRDDIGVWIKRLIGCLVFTVD